MDNDAIVTKRRNRECDTDDGLDVREHTVALHKDSVEYLKDKAAMEQLRAFRDLIPRKKAAE